MNLPFMLKTRNGTAWNFRNNPQNLNFIGILDLFERNIQLIYFYNGLICQLIDPEIRTTLTKFFNPRRSTIRYRLEPER